MKIGELASARNLDLAWRRITTGANAQYKRLYRHLYYAYEISLKENLRDLRQRLRGGTFAPNYPERVYIPKASGLHRPVSLLNIEDQVVLQAFANIAAKRLQRRRAPLQLNVVFSNILEKPDSIFFLRKWQQTYAAFQRQIRSDYNNKMRWVGDFDLAAFYDTISHELLLKTIFPRSQSPDIDWLAGCLRTWSSDRKNSGHAHGLPQGPLASDFLAECFLLPIDLELQKRKGYLRYVDDVRLLGRTEDEVRENLIELERQCRERGLIPQTGKFAIKRAHSLQDAMGMLPSISDPHHESGDNYLPRHQAMKEFRSSLGGKPYRIVDKTRARYVLYRAQSDTELLQLVLRLIPRHPEHTDAFFTYLQRFPHRAPIERLCLQLIQESPYAYVRGEAWHILAQYRTDSRATATAAPAVTNAAIRVARLKGKSNFAELWGACHFLCASEESTGNKHSRFLKYQAPLIQSFCAPSLPKTAFAKEEAAVAYLKRTSPEPGLSISAALHQYSKEPSALGVNASVLPNQVANTLRTLGVLFTKGGRVDPIAETLKARYGTPATTSWHKLLGTEYVHALGLLKQAEATFDSGRSFWLACQNSFNQTAFIALQRHLHNVGHPAACTIFSWNGQLVDYGVTLDPNGPFSKAHPTIASCFREMNARRNSLPPVHPYAKKTALRAQHLKAPEKRRLVAKLRAAYRDFVKLMP